MSKLRLWQQAVLLGGILLVLAWLLVDRLVLEREMDYHQQSIEYATSDLVNVVTASSIDALISEDSILLKTVVNQIISENPDVFSITIANEKGEILVSELDENSGSLDPLKISKPVMFEGEHFGTVELVLNLQSLKQAVAGHMSNVSWLLGLIFLAGGVVLAAAIHTLFLRPMRAVQQRLLTMSKGDYAAEIQLSGSYELVELSRKMNYLSSTLEENRINEQNFRHRLQTEVDARTEELNTLYQEVKRKSLHDVLTGLPNRAYFYERAECQLQQQDAFVGMLFLDLDNFKEINDAYGHEMGDALLKAVAIRLSHVAHEDDTVSRLGGDEFTVLLSHVESLEDIISVAEKILYAMKKGITIEGETLSVSPSIGISVYPQDALNTRELIRNADAAMYGAKQMGKGCYLLYSDWGGQLNAAHEDAKSGTLRRL